jgi:hypothetical protein
VQPLAGLVVDLMHAIGHIFVHFPVAHPTGDDVADHQVAARGERIPE